MTTTIATFAQGEGLHRSRTVPKEPTTPNPTATLQRTARIHTTVTQDTCGDLFFSPSSVARAAAVWHITSLCWGIGREIVKGGRNDHAVEEVSRNACKACGASLGFTLTGDVVTT